ncbi:hypothetical protein A5765_06050 [Mycolicibacterium celeriflavum]|uniref:hypothetical protein n=1 Tax=Mycolicibacterium celeriflavum TaxID=1249101 RepID=UPI000801B244|nr:hypothetical protein [Mycolicibacterium celeriflavum]OBG17665.1 hypothetical protein A5765_06050 [Mycolicibacterium celeriflavum]
MPNDDYDGADGPSQPWRNRTPTTTHTITSTSPPQTTEIGAPLDTPTSPLPPSTSESSAETTSASPTLEDDEGEESTERTTRRSPLTNVTRTFDPNP